MVKQDHNLGAYQGELVALLSSVSISIAPYFFLKAYSKECSPLLLNFWKGLISLIIFGVLIFLTQQSFFPEGDNKTYILLAISGIFGVGLGDLFYFLAFNTLGPQWVIIIETVTPCFIGITSFFYFGTTLSFLQWMGIVISGIGLYIVVQKDQQKELQEQKIENVKVKKAQNEENHQVYKSKLDQENQIQEIKTQNSFQLNEEFANKSSNHLIEQATIENKEIKKIHSEHHTLTRKQILGILYGIGFGFFQSVGVVLASGAAQSNQFTSLEASFFRILIGQVYIFVHMILTCEKFFWPSDNMEQSSYFLGGIITCSIIAVWGEQQSIKFIRPEICFTIIAGSPLFNLIFSFIRREEVKCKYIIGSLICIIGVSMVIWF